MVEMCSRVWKYENVDERIKKIEKGWWKIILIQRFVKKTHSSNAL